MKNSIIKAVGVILCAAGLCGMLGGCSLFENPEQARREFEKYPHYLYVKTVTVPEKEDVYYDLNDHGDYRRCEAFEPNADVIEFHLELQSDRKVSEAFSTMGSDYDNAANEKVPMPENVDKAIFALDRFEGKQKHWIWVDRVFICGEKCFLSVGYNVNMQVPYSLLEYDEESDTLKEILYVSDRQIVGLKM